MLLEGLRGFAPLLDPVALVSSVHTLHFSAATRAFASSTPSVSISSSNTLDSALDRSPNRRACDPASYPVTLTAAYGYGLATNRPRAGDGEVGEEAGVAPVGMGEVGLDQRLVVVEGAVERLAPAGGWPDSGGATGPASIRSRAG